MAMKGNNYTSGWGLLFLTEAENERNAKKTRGCWP
jgi:hypothetical protein